MAIARLSSALLLHHPAEAARILEKHPTTTVAALLQELPTKVIADVLAECLPLFSAAFLHGLPVEMAADIIEELEAAKALPMLRHTPPERREIVLDALPSGTGSAYRRLLSYPRDCAGAHMNPFALILREDMTVSDAMQRVRHLGNEVFYFPYIVDLEQRLVGILTVRDLMRAAPKQRLKDVMRSDVVRVPVTATFGVIDRIPGCRAYQSLPVVDPKGTLVGVLPQDSLRTMEEDQEPTSEGMHLADGVVAVGEVFMRSQAALIPLMADAISAVISSPEKEGPRHAG
jgi:magnesium transporter